MYEYVLCLLFVFLYVLSFHHPSNCREEWNFDIYLQQTNSVNPFLHTTILQQTTLNKFCQNIENLYNWMDNLWLKAENIVAKGEIARFEQFLYLSLCFQKTVCCRGVRNLSVYMRERLTMWQKRKLFKTNNFSFCNNVFQLI